MLKVLSHASVDIRRRGVQAFAKRSRLFAGANLGQVLNQRAMGC
jgi:hypothetical protein